MSRFPNRRWAVISSNIIPNIDFNQVLESSSNALRYSIDGTQTFVKYEGSKPSSIPTNAIEYTHSEILELLATEAWTIPVNENYL